MFGTALADIYNLSNIIPTTEVTLKQSTTIEPHVPLIREAILAFYSGMKIVAIGALIPIVESILTKLVGNNNSELVLIDKVHSCINSAIENVIRDHYGEFTWIPSEYVDLKYLKVVDERIFMLETLRGWLVNSFYVKTKSYENVSGFNRHIFAHAKSDDWQNGENFFRALGIIQALAFVEAYAIDNSAVSIFGPDPDSNCEALREEIFACLNYQSLKQQVLTLQKQSRGLPFNPTSSDDGWLTRASMLSDAMNNVIIPQLKEKGWDCFEVSDPEKDGEYVTVKSRKDDACLNVALLFSCATDNSIYRSLAKEHSYILYSGAQYHQKEFARDVDAVVRPMNAWIAPENA
ncbi:Uncharacterised protein [BD1-7 clade bacterium]|uniref:Uncharacterized protein n=1 Tax=BD1-7 clade bacterium TaxID=2029982 RepID=A0A5S9PC51_9GAMM|nr:Uncharacterised protein [BD1-7 clade bacterium]CAA0101913.1 Uncharacterised protein [BD1-7 clade bacterium]